MEQRIQFNIARGIRIGIMVAIGLVLFVIVGGFVVRGLWNWLLPELFGWPLISFWQGLGLLALSRILFGGIGGPGGPGRRGRKGKGGRGKPHWADLSEEESERLKQQIAHAKDEGETM